MTAATTALTPVNDGRCADTVRSGPRKGQRCPVRAMPGRIRCRYHEAGHDKALAEHVKRERELGGLRAAMPQVFAAADFPTPALNDREAVRAVLAGVLRGVLIGELSPSVANSAFQGIGVALRLAELEIESQLAAIELELERDRGHSFRIGVQE